MINHRDGTTRRAVPAILGILLALGSAVVTSCSPQHSGSQDQLTPVALSPGQGDEILLQLDSGDWTAARLWSNGYATSRTAIVFVTGVNGGFEEPVDRLYDRFATEFSAAGIPALFVQYRYPGELESSVDDARAAADYFKQFGIDRLAIVGWSFGGAVAIHSAVQIPEISTVVTISAQSLDTEAVSSFARQSLLVIHSAADENVPFYAAEQILSAAPFSIRKSHYWLQDSDHLLTGASGLIDPVFRRWISGELAR